MENCIKEDFFQSKINRKSGMMNGMYCIINDSDKSVLFVIMWNQRIFGTLEITGSHLPVMYNLYLNRQAFLQPQGLYVSVSFTYIFIWSFTFEERTIIGNLIKYPITIATMLMPLK